EEHWLLLDARQLGVRRDPGAVPGKVSFAHRSGPHVSARWCAISGKSLRVRPKRGHRARGPNPLSHRAPPPADGLSDTRDPPPPPPGRLASTQPFGPICE